MRFSFFESEKIAGLFLSDKVDAYNKTVVIYSKNDQYKEYIGSFFAAKVH